MALPSTGTREDAQTYTLRRLEKRYGDKIEFVYPDQYCGRIFHDHARNAYVEQFLKSDCDLMWFLDSDVIPPENVLDLVTEHGDKWKLAGAPYPVWMTPAGYENKQVVYTVYRNTEHAKMAACNIPMQGQDFVDGIATGCIFIHREVLEKLSKPYFEFKYHPETRDIVEGEDLGFCKKTSELGYQFFIDYTMVCHHYKKVSLVEVNNYAMEYAQKAVLASHRAFKQELAKRRLEQKPKSRLILPK